MAAPGLVPPNLTNRLLHHVLLAAVETKPLVPRPIAPGRDLKAPVLLGHLVATPKALEQLAKGRAAGDVGGAEFDLRTGGKLPGGRVRVEDVGFGVLSGEEVVVAWFAAHPA